MDLDKLARETCTKLGISVEPGEPPTSTRYRIILEALEQAVRESSGDQTCLLYRAERIAGVPCGVQECEWFDPSSLFSCGYKNREGHPSGAVMVGVCMKYKPVKYSSDEGK